MAETVHGLKDLERVLLELPRSTAKGTVRRAMTKAATPMRDLMASLAPDDPSSPPLDLHTSIAVSSKQKGGRQISLTRAAANEVVIYIGPTSEGYPQAIMQEFGTIHHPAQPFARPAWEQGNVDMLTRFSVLIGQEIDKTVARVRKRRGF